MGNGAEIRMSTKIVEELWILVLCLFYIKKFKICHNSHCHLLGNYGKPGNEVGQQSGYL